MDGVCEGALLGVVVGGIVGQGFGLCFGIFIGGLYHSYSLWPPLLLLLDLEPLDPF
jgi:hypothetical protein